MTTSITRDHMVSVKEVDTQVLLEHAATQLKGLGMEKPEWARFVKTGPSRERPPQQDDWWWMRAAGVLRQVYLETQGVSSLRRVYGGRKNRGHKPEHTFRGSGKIIRTVLKQLEENGMVKIEKGKGRVITPKGQQFLDGVAKQVRGQKKEKRVKEPQKVEKPVTTQEQAPVKEKE